MEIWQNGALQRTGVIEATTVDSAIAWVAADGYEPRRLLERASGFELRISREQFPYRAERRGTG